VVTRSRVLIGFDGFIDTLLHCVAQRHSPTSFKRLATIPEFSQKIQKAASQSANIECVVKDRTIGGNAPLLALAVSSLGHKGILLGTCGYPSKLPIFHPLETLGLTVYSFAEPGLTDAFEFTDGKLLFGKMGELNHLTLQEALARLPKNTISSLVRSIEILATVNWTMMPLVGEFWDYLLENRSLLKKGLRKSLFVDLADPAKRPVKDLKKALLTLKKLAPLCSVILGLNRSESTQVLHALKALPSASLVNNAKKILSLLNLSTVVIHTHPTVAAAWQHQGKIFTSSLSVPLCNNPVRSTGAGDTFNAGFISGLLQHLLPSECLKMAVAASGIFVRTGIEPTPQTMEEFLHLWKRNSLS
jgi:hypothetical protein